MKFGFRTPSLKRSLSARFSPKRKIKNALGLRMPRGTGWITNPKKAIYNKVYNKTSFGISDIFKTTKSKSKKISQLNINSITIALILFASMLLCAQPWLLIVIGVGYAIYYLLNKRNKTDVTSSEDTVTEIADQPNSGLKDWYANSFTQEERKHMKSVYQPFGINTSLQAEIAKLGGKETLQHLTNLTGYFDNPRDRHIAFRIINKAEEFINQASILDKHFFWSSKMTLYYRERRTDSNNLEIAIDSAEKQIELAPEAAVQFKKDGFDRLPSHSGYVQLCIILDKQGKYEEAIKLAERAKEEGWSEDWDKRIGRLQDKLSKKKNDKKIIRPR